MKATIIIVLLDDTEVSLTYDKKAKAQTLINQVNDHLQLIERDYFGLAFPTKPGQPRDWLNSEKPLGKQIKRLGSPDRLNFEVKFYPSEPVQLHEDITRYYVCLQVRRDVLSGRLPCSFVTHALLGSYLVQSELGDYDPLVHKPGYLKSLQFAPQQTEELESKVAELHRNHQGQTPAEADLHYLECARKLAMYGVDLHPAKDSSGISIEMGVCASGVHVYRHRLRINRFSWIKILKISYKRNNFHIRIRPGEFDYCESTICFKLSSLRAAKRLWQNCVENHTFFRLTTPEGREKHHILPRFGSKFRYSGRTLHQSRQSSQQIKRVPPEFQRALSKSMIYGTKAPRRYGDDQSSEIYGKTGDRKYEKEQPSDNYARTAERKYQEELSLENQNKIRDRKYVEDKPLDDYGKARERQFVEEQPIENYGRVRDRESEEQTVEKQAPQQDSRRRPVGGVAVLPPIGADNTDGAPHTGGQIQESSKQSSQTITSKTRSHKTDEEDHSKPDEGLIHKKKIDTTVEQTRTTRKQTETRNMVITGKYQDIAPIIYKEMVRYGASPLLESQAGDDGMIENSVEHTITIRSDADLADHDRKLAEAIEEVTMMDPRMTVQRIEVSQVSQIGDNFHQ